MPENPGQTVLWLEKARLAVRRPGALPFAVELSPVKEALVVAGVIADPLDTAAESKTQESAILYVTREDWASVQSEFEQLVEEFASLKVQLLPDGPLPWLARGLAADDAVNLLQGEFARTADYGAAGASGAWPPFSPRRCWACTSPPRRCRSATRSTNRRRSTAKYRRYFPRPCPATAFRSSPSDAGSRLDRIRKSGAGPQYFLRALQTLSSALAITPKTTIDAMSYRDESLDMTVNTHRALRRSRSCRNWSAKTASRAEIQSSNPVAGGVEAHLHIRTPKIAGAPMNTLRAWYASVCSSASSAWSPSAPSSWR